MISKVYEVSWENIAHVPAGCVTVKLNDGKDLIVLDDPETGVVEFPRALASEIIYAITQVLKDDFDASVKTEPGDEQ